MSLFILLRVLLRKALPAAVIMVLLLTAIIVPASVGTTPVDLIVTGIVCILIMTVLLRFGLLASIAAFLLMNMLSRFPLGLGADAWFVGQSIAGWMLILAFVVYAFVVALGGRAVFRDSVLDEG